MIDSILRPRRPAPAEVVTVPRVRLDHLRRLTDEIGIIQFAERDVPATDSGYCVDDVARLGIVAAGLSRLPGLDDPALARWQIGCVRFLAAATSVGGMHNLMTYHGAWLDRPHLGDHVGRAVWGLGVLAATGTAEVRGHSLRALERLLDLVERLCHPRSVAYALLGLAALADPPPRVRILLGRGLARLTAPRDEGDEQPIDAAAAVELAVTAWQATGDPRYAHAARQAFGWFLGANRAAVPLYDRRTGGCRDGLSDTMANPNQGAESTLAYYQAMLAVFHAGLLSIPGPDVAVPRQSRPHFATAR